MLTSAANYFAQILILKRERGSVGEWVHGFKVLILILKRGGLCLREAWSLFWFEQMGDMKAWELHLQSKYRSIKYMRPTQTRMVMKINHKKPDPCFFIMSWMIRIHTTSTIAQDFWNQLQSFPHNSFPALMWKLQPSPDNFLLSSIEICCPAWHPAIKWLKKGFGPCQAINGYSC